MASSLTRLCLRRISRPLCANRELFSTTSVRSLAGWNKDWKPGPYPETAAERLAAAKKYGLRPEDYRPYPDDGFGYGDYPMLDPAPAESRDPHEVWDMPEYKRNYGEPVHVDADAMTEDRWNPNAQWRYSFGQMIAFFVAVVGGITGVYFLTINKPHFQPVLPKQYPKDGKAHYSFEAVD